MKKLILIPFLLSAFVSWGQHVNGKPAYGNIQIDEIDSGVGIIDTTSSFINVDSIISKMDTVETITYCLNTETLDVKWIRLRALYGWNYPYVSFNGLIIYNKYLNIPKDYKPIYSIQP